MIVRIPPGTILTDDDTGEVIGDLTRHGQQVVVARGGRGGRGNIRFATPNNPAPELAENGEEGEERYVTMELKVMADVGLVGFPSRQIDLVVRCICGSAKDRRIPLYDHNAEFGSC